MERRSRHTVPVMSAPHPPAPPQVIVGDDGLARPAWAARDPLLRTYYDTEWGVPIRDEQGLYERLVLEGFQAGLSWATILRKRDAFRSAFAGFDPDQVAGFGEAEVQRLLQDAGIVRHEGKIRATIQNARATLALRPRGGLSDLIWSFLPERTPVPRVAEALPSQTPESTALSRALRHHGFRFVGPTTAYALMSAIGMADLHLVGSHRRGCSRLWNPDGTRR